MISTATKIVNDIERLVLQTLDGMTVRIRASSEGLVIAEVYRNDRLLAHNSSSSVAKAVELAFGSETIRRLLLSAQSSAKEPS